MTTRSTTSTKKEVLYIDTESCGVTGTTSSVCGGTSNTINGDYSFIGGGYSNDIYGSPYTFIGGGESNLIDGNISSSDYSIILGGSNNKIYSNIVYSTILNGDGNILSGSGGFANIIAAGDNNTIIGVSSEYNSIAGGSGNNVTSSYGTIAGGRDNNVASLYGTIAGGYGAKTTVAGQQSFASGRFGTIGDAQSSKYILRISATDVNPKVLTTNAGAAAATNQIHLEDGQSISFIGTVTAKQDASTNLASWKVDGVAVREGATTTLVAHNETVISNVPGWTLTVQADDTNECIQFVFTGPGAANIRIVAAVDTSEVIY